MSIAVNINRIMMGSFPALIFTIPQSDGFIKFIEEYNAMVSKYCSKTVSDDDGYPMHVIDDEYSSYFYVEYENLQQKYAEEIRARRTQAEAILN